VNSSAPKGQAVPAPLDFTTEFDVSLEDFMTKKDDYLPIYIFIIRIISLTIGSFCPYL